MQYSSHAVFGWDISRASPDAGRSVRLGARRRDSPATRVLPAERQAGRRRSCHEALLRVGDVALDEAQGLPALDDPPDGPELLGPHRLQEIDLQLQGREG